MAITPENQPKCQDCGKDMAIFEKGSPEYDEIDRAIGNILLRLVTQ
jgi:glutaredoxin